jgi:threonine dehydrogenase-like Zn-dependent dehydrogenase
VKALVLKEPGVTAVESVADLAPSAQDVLLKIRMVGLCGSDLNSFRGKNPMVSFPRVLGHEVAATVVSSPGDLQPGTDVTLSPYTSCGRCASCLRGREPSASMWRKTSCVSRVQPALPTRSTPRPNRCMNV